MKKAPRPVWDARLTAAQNAKAVLPGLAGHFFAAGRRLAARAVSPKKLHQFRVYVNPALDKGEIANYINWMRSDEAQKLVKDIGYFPLPDHLRVKATESARAN